MGEELCESCKLPIKECICCPECGHICRRDLPYNEPYCPVCGPKRPKV